jgi:hypothetical protein
MPVPVQTEDLIHAIVVGDHPEAGESDPGYELAVIDLLRADLLKGERTPDGTICLSLTDFGHDALAILSRIDDPADD